MKRVGEGLSLVVFVIALCIAMLWDWLTTPAPPPNDLDYEVPEE